MARDDAPPFNRGEYEATSGAFDHLVGRKYVFEDLNWGSTASVKPHRSGKLVTCMLVKNGSAVAILPKYTVQFDTTAGADKYNAVASGLVAVTNQRGFPADEFLPAAGVPASAYFYVVTEGPAIVKTPLAGSEFNGDIAVGSVLAALTAASSGATTAGRVANQTITGSSQATSYGFVIDAAQNYIARALSAATTGQTNSDLLVDVGHW